VPNTPPRSLVNIMSNPIMSGGEAKQRMHINIILCLLTNHVSRGMVKVFEEHKEVRRT
jgi:hypothetical protein